MSPGSRFQSGILAGTGVALISLGTFIGYFVGNVNITGNTTVGGNITVQGTLSSSGGLLPIVANLTESSIEGDGTTSGFTIQNPYSEAVLCDRVAIRTATAPTDGSTTIDMDVGTGTFASGASSGNTLLDSYTLAAETKVASGTRIAFASGYQKAFVLDAAGGTTDYFMLYPETGTGGGWIADFHAACYSLD